MSFVNWNKGPLKAIDQGITGGLDKVGHALGINPCRAHFVPIADEPARDVDEPPGDAAQALAALGAKFPDAPPAA